MQALVRSNGAVSVQNLPKPVVADGRTVVLRVTLAGLCRTDLYAAEGRIKVCEPLVLGHEFCGVVDAVGSDVESVRVGQRVAVNPLLCCTNCHHCAFIGIDHPGCFAEYVAVPERSVHLLPEGVSDSAAAYAEPIAASLAVLKAGIKPGEKGLIYGRNRFSQLLVNILRIRGHENVTVFDPATEDKRELEGADFDYVIETMLTADTLRDVTSAVRPCGKIILKSRQYEPVSFVMTELLKKEPTLHVVNYGSFEEALELLVSGQIQVDDLIDGIYRLDEFKSVLATASRKESLKPFFAPGQG
jgi:L-iditol 2-dehydrogenase